MGCHSSYPHQCSSVFDGGFLSVCFLAGFHKKTLNVFNRTSQDIFGNEQRESPFSRQIQVKLKQNISFEGLSGLSLDTACARLRAILAQCGMYTATSNTLSSLDMLCSHDIIHLTQLSLIPIGAFGK